MNRVIRFVVAMGLGIAALLVVPKAGAAEAVGGSPHRTPVLLELFTSEGCSSCPPADQLLQMLDRSQPVAGAELIVLSEHVDYWNHGGWSDPYSSAAFSQRQTDYASKFGLDGVYTPQLVVDGRAELVGSNGAAARRAIVKAASQSKLPIPLTNVVRQKDKVSVHVEFGPAGEVPLQSKIYVALADEEDRSQVFHGENAGRSLVHVAVVRTLLAVGTVSTSGFSKDITVPIRTNASRALRLVVFVQDPTSKRVLAVTQAKL